MEKPKTIYFTDETDNGVVHPDFTPDEETAETEAAIVGALSVLGIFLIALILCIIF